MGKATERLSERMTLGVMCENLVDTALSDMRETKCENENDIRTINLFEHFEDVDVLKSRVQNVMTSAESREQVTNRETIHTGGGDVDNSTLKTSSNCNGDDVGHIHRSHTHGYVPDSSHQNSNEDPNTTRSSVQISSSEKAIGDCGDIMVQSKVGNQLSSKIASGIKSGLVMSPITLTQDMPVSVANSNRFSRVLENMPLPLIYIPTTKQLVSGQNCTENDNQNSVSFDETNSSADYGKEFCNGSDTDDLTQNISDISLHSQFSEGTYELADHVKTCRSLDVDMRSNKDPDQLTLHSVDCLIPQPGERMYTDVSSLSSVSTNTDFSVSAASLGEEYTESKSISCETEEGGFSDVNLYSRNSYERTETTSQDRSSLDKGAKPKKGGISSFLSRYIYCVSTGVIEALFIY